MSTSRDDFGIVIRSALLQRGAKQKFSLFVLILLSLFIFILDNSNLKPIKILRSLINDGIYRISAVSSSPIRFSGASKDFFVKHIFTYEENERLRKELEDLKSKNFQSSFLEAENNKLQNVLDLEKNSPYSVVNAKVILDKNSPFLNSVIINKGSNAGIKLGMPVLNEGYLAGRIVEVNFVSSRILLLNDLNSRIPVVVSPSGTQAILSGVGKREPSLEYLPDNFMLGEKESIVFTSGKDGVLFPGIAIGKVVLNDNKKLVKLFADPDQISVVSVALDQQEDSGAR
jgi:rod shape-determining protein MreC